MGTIKNRYSKIGTIKNRYVKKKSLKGVNKFVPQKIRLKGLTNSLNKKWVQ